MKKVLIIILIGAAFYQWFIGKNTSNVFVENPSENVSYSKASNSNSAIEHAYKKRQSNLQVNGIGTVIKLLPDDNVGVRHQKFILRLSSGQTLLIAHNIDLAPSVNGNVKLTHLIS